MLSFAMIFTRETTAGASCGGNVRCSRKPPSTRRRTATEVAPHDLGIGGEVQKHLEVVAGAFQRALTNAKRKGEVAEDFDPAEMGFYLTGVLQGAAVLGRAGFERQRIGRYVEKALEPLG